MRHLIVIAALVMLAGCATHPIAPEDARPVPSARILAHGEQAPGTEPVQITRDAGGFDDRLCQVQLLIDGTQSAIIENGETVRLYVTPGQHIFGVGHVSGMCGFGNVETVATVPETQRLRVYFPTNGGLRISPTAF